MPSKNSRKPYLPGAHYHIYNRGVEKRDIFLDQQDYSVFLSYLKAYLLPKDITDLRNKLSSGKLSLDQKDKVLKELRLNNFFDEITLMAYCLMPNHFHFLLRQNTENGIDQFMNSLCTRYVGYFNRKYRRVGHLYQGVYKAVPVESDEQLLHLSRYIHRNPLSFQSLQGLALQTQPSSYLEFLGLKSTTWVHPEAILPFSLRVTGASPTKILSLNKIPTSRAR